jgi:hypothetical protein
MVRNIQGLLSADNVCNLAVFLARPRYRTFVEAAALLVLSKKVEAIF